MTKRDGHLLTSRDDDDNDKVLPPVRSPVTIEPQKKKENVKSMPGNSRRIKSTDFASWDKYDVSRASTLVEKDDIDEKGSLSKEIHVPPLQLSGATLNELERGGLAAKEREKGNEEFRAGDYEKALAYYTRSIEYLPSAAAYNNKALTCNKLGLYSEAVDSCLEVLKMEPKNTKALIRRANAYASLKQYGAAQMDVDTVLQLEPDNKRAQEFKAKIEANRPNNYTETSGSKKGKRLVIEEVEKPEESAQNMTTEQNATDAVITKEPVNLTAKVLSQPALPLPSHIQKHKDQGNSLFRCGQYGSAVSCYTTCIKLLESEKGNYNSSLATILSNRAACHFKNGDCRSCIDDATQSIELSPVNLKSFIRRAQAYETMEKYKQAYCDYQIALKIDARVDKAREASSRISFLLRDAHGNNWRDLLPASTDIDRVTAAMSTATLAYHQQVSDATVVSSSKPVSATHSFTGNKTDKDFDDSKMKGNTLVKDGQYAAASSCYTYCIDLCPNEVAPYTNRALCFLKLNDFVSAESDCSKALELETNNVKALYRRALARKNLKKLNEALKDLRRLTAIDPDNTAAVKEEKLVYDLYLTELRNLQVQASTLPSKETKQYSEKLSMGQATSSSNPAVDKPTFIGKTKKRKVVIEEIDEEASTVVNSPLSKIPNPPAIKKSIASIKQEKLSVSQYIQLWNSLSKSSTSYDYAVVLMKVPPSLLPQVITNKLEGHSLSGIISAVDEYILKEGLYQVAYSVISSLTNVQRFSTILMFLQAKDRQILTKIFSAMENSGIGDLTELKHSYS